MGHRIHKLTVTVRGHVSVRCSCGWTPNHNVFYSETDAKLTWATKHDVLPTERSGKIRYDRSGNAD